MPVPLKVRTPRPALPVVAPLLDTRRPPAAMDSGPADLVRARTLVGNAAVTAAMGGLPPGSGPAPSGWRGQMLLAGQDLVGNQAVAARAATPPKPAPVGPKPPAPAGKKPHAGLSKATAPPVPKPDQKDPGTAPAERQDKGAAKKEAASPRSPGADPKFQALKKDVTAKKKTVGSSHPPATAEAGAAQAASVPPADDQEARGKAAHAEDMDAAQPKEFNKTEFVKAVEDAIAKRAPKNLDEADKFGESGKAEEAKAEVQGKVDEGKEASAQEIADTTAQPPQPAPDAKEVVPLAADKVPGKPGTPNPNQAAPDTLPPSATDMSAGPAQVDQQMADAQVTEQQLSFKNSREPAFDKAVKDKKTLEAHSDTAPARLRAGEAKELKQAKNTAAAQGSAAMGAMHGTRVATGQQVGTGKTGAKSRDEDKRTQVTTLLQEVFDRTKCDVEKILSDLDKKVDDQFTKEEKEARDRFTKEHTDGMDRYKDERYSGLTGKARWVKDLFADLPEEANRIYERAKANYLTAMGQVIRNIADTIAGELRRAKDRIAAGRTELKAAVDKLPADLKAIGREAATEFEGQFDELKDTVNDKGTELVDTLATKYTDAVKAVDEEIAAEKEKNKGLVSKAADAIGGIIKTIKELASMLMGVLRKAASAIGLILKDPIGFLGNLITGVGGWLKLFMRNAGRHLQQGVLAWLLGTGASAGLQLPTSFDILGILMMLAALLGLTWPNIRARIVRKVPHQAVTAAETAVPLVAQAKKRGVAGLWDDLKTRVGDLKKDLIGNLVSYLLPTIIIAGVTWIVSLFNPASAFIRACKMIIDIIRFIVTQGRQIIEFVNTVLDAVIAIARGGTGGVPALVERALVKSIPVLIGALAAILGIGGIAGKVKQIFQKLARPVNRAVDWVINKIVGLVKKLWAKLKAKLDKRKKRRKKPSLLARAKAKVRGGDDSPAGQRKRLSAALAAGVKAVNRYRGRPVAGKILNPLLTVIRVRYGLSVLQPVVKGDHWAVYGRINPEETRDSDARTEGAQTTDANPNFAEDAKAFERKLAATASSHSASNGAMATMAGKAKVYIELKVGGWSTANKQLAEILKVVGQGGAESSGFVGTEVENVMAVFDEGTLSERFVHIVRFFTEILGRDLANDAKAAQIEQFIVQAEMNVAFLRRRRGVMRRRARTPADVTTHDIAPVREGSDVRFQRRSRMDPPAGTSRLIGLTAAETGLELSERQLAMQRRDDPDWDKERDVLKWIAGSKRWMMNDKHAWVKIQRELGLPLGAGPSGTTNTMMTAAEALGGEKYATRLACIAFLIGAKHHSLIEILVAAAPFSATYNKAEPKKIYRDIQPLSEGELRACGKNGKFPDEAPDGDAGTRR